jgi:hypothetical protein
LDQPILIIFQLFIDKVTMIYNTVDKEEDIIYTNILNFSNIVLHKKIFVSYFF